VTPNQEPEHRDREAGKRHDFVAKDAFAKAATKMPFRTRFINKEERKK